jgi:hypothetical protein
LNHNLWKLRFLDVIKSANAAQQFDSPTDPMGAYFAVETHASIDRQYLQDLYAVSPPFSGHVLHLIPVLAPYMQLATNMAISVAHRNFPCEISTFSAL